MMLLKLFWRKPAVTPYAIYRNALLSLASNHDDEWFKFNHHTLGPWFGLLNMPLKSECYRGTRIYIAVHTEKKKGLLPLSSD